MSRPDDRRTIQVGIIGLGLIGGSIARDLAATGYRVLAHDRDRATLDDACAAGVVHQRIGDSLEGAGEADILVVAVHVSALYDVLAAARPYLAKARLIMDVGSTKRSAIAAAESLEIGDRFVGSHPMAGDHRSGFAASRRGLFAGAPVYLCPTRSTRQDALDRARELWSVLGAQPEMIDAGLHDLRMAYASHLPRAMSTALALAIGGAGVERAHLGPGGRDATRLAAGSVDMWAAIATDNADTLVEAISALEAHVVQLRRALERRDANALRALFEDARAWAVADRRTSV